MNDTEKRVVELEFDNKHFEKNVKQSMSTIDKLDEKLSLEGVTDSVKKVNKSFKKMDMVVFTVLQRLTNKVIDLGVQLVKSLSTDNIFAGWIKYGEKTVSVATMFSQEIKIAGKAIEDDTEKLKVINEQLDKLNWFTDETSYNFTDMVDSISKFTAAGVDLDQSVEAMMGIANWAALSGQNATTASRAMYQLAQSLGKGYVQLIDYKSIQNANMDTQEFRQTVLDTAVELKMLTKEGEKYITKTGKSFTKNQFTEELSEKWFSSEVLTKSLEKYSAAVDKIYEIAQETGLTASEVISRYGDELDEFGIKAFKAAQEARTFRDSLNSVKDAVSTGWMTTAEKIFGSYEESKELWTDLANELYDVFAAGGNFRNQVLSIWKDLDGRSNLFKHGGADQGAFWNMYDAVVALKGAVKDAWRSLFPLTEFQAENDQAKDLANKLNNITKRFKDWSAKLKESLTTSSKFYNVMRAAFSIVKAGVVALQGVLYILNPIWTAIKQMFNYLTTRVSLVGKNLNKLESVFNSIQSAVEKIHDVVENLVEAIDPVGVLDKIFVGISNITKVIKDYHPIEKLSNFFNEFIDSLKKNGTNAENFKRIWSGVVSILSMSLKLIKTIAGFLFKFLSPILEVVLTLAANIVSVISGLLSHIMAAIGDFFTFLNGLFEGKTSDIGAKINNFCDKFAANLSKLKPLLSSITGIVKNLVQVVLAIPKALNNLSIKLTGNGIVENIRKIGEGIANAIKSVADAIAKLFTGSNKDIKNPKKSGKNNIVSAAVGGMFGTTSLKEANQEANKASEFIDALKELLDGIVSVLNGILSILSAMVSALGRLLKSIGDILKEIGEAFKDFFETMDFSSLGTVLGVLASVGIIFLIAKMVYNLFYGIKSLLAPVQYVAEAAGDLMDGLRYFLTFRGVSYLLDAVALMLLAFSASLLILVHVIDDKNWPAAISALGVFTGIIIALTITLMILAKALNGTQTVTKKLGKSSKIWDREVTKTSTTTGAALASLSRIIGVLTTGMIKIAIALRLMKDIGSDQLVRASAVLGIFLIVISAIMIALTAISAKSKSVKLDSKALSKTTTSIIKFSLGLRLLASSITALGKMDADKMWQGIAGMSVILLAFSAFVFLMQNKWTNLQGANADYKGLSKLLFKFALAIFAITLSLKILDSISSEKFEQYAFSLLALIGIFGVLVTALTLITKSTKKVTSISKKMRASAASVAETALKILAVGASFALMASSLLIIVGAIALLSTINWSKALPGLFVIIGFLAGFTGVILLINKQSIVLKKGQKTAAMNLLALSADIVAMTTGLLVLTAAIAILSTINWSKAWPGLIVIGVFLGALIAMVAIVATKAGIASGVSKSAHKAILSLSVVLLAFVGSLIVIAAALALISLINWKQAWPGLVIMGLLLASLITMLSILSTQSKQALLASKGAKSSLLALSVLLAALSGAMTVIAASLLIFATADMEAVGKMAAGVGLLVAVIASMVAALLLLQSAGINSKSLINFGLALGIMVVALLGFIGALYLLNGVSWSSLGKGAIILAGGLAILAISGIALKPVIPVILEIALALFLLAAAFMLTASALGVLSEALGPAMEDFNANFDMIAETIGNVASLLVVALLDAFETLLTKVTDILPEIADFLIEFISELLRIISELAPQIGSTLVTVLTSILEVLVQYADVIWESILKLVSSLLKMLKQYVPTIVADLCDILILVIQNVTKYIVQIVGAIFDLLTKIIDTVFGPQGQEFFLHAIATLVTFIGNMLSYLVNYVIQFAGLVAKLLLILLSAALQLALASLGTIASYLIAFFGGLIWLCVEVVRGLAQVIYTALKNIFVIIVEALGQVLVDIFPLMLAAGRYLILSLAEGMLQAIESSFIGTILKFFGVSFDGAHQTLNNARKDLMDTMTGIAGDMGTAIKTASSRIMNTVGTVVGTMQEITEDGLEIISSTVDSSASNIGNAMADFGKNMTMNLAEGISQGTQDNMNTVTQSAVDMADEYKDTVQETLEVHSPSRFMMRIGQYLDEGLAIGVEDNTNTVVDAMTEAVKKTVDTVDAMVEEGVGENTLTIKPVLDLDNVSEGVNDISSMMTSINGGSIATNLAGKTASEIRRSQAEARRSQSQNQNGKGNVTNEGDTYYSTFNVTTNDPESFVDEVDRLLQRKRLQLKTARGG